MADVDIPDDAPQPAPDAAKPAEILRPAEPGESTDKAEAAGARETIGAAVEQKAAKRSPAPQPAEAPARESRVEENPYERYLKGPQDDGPNDLERARLNMVNSYYRGSAAGALALSQWAKIYKEPDPPDIEPGMKEARQHIRDQYENVVLDFMKYDMMPSWSGLPQLGAAIGGSVAGALPSPESFVGWAAKGATWTARTMWAGFQQGLISGVTDPAVQMLNMESGVQKDYSGAQTVGAVAFGAVIGSGFHAAGEGVGHFIGQRELRRELTGIADSDPGFDSPYVALWRLDPRNGIEAPRMEPVPPPSTATPAERPIGPAHSFEDAVAFEKEKLVAQPMAGQTAKRANEAARFNAFHEEAGPILDAAVAEHQLDPESVRYGNIWQHYDRAPGETPSDALERAIGKWVSAEEREAIKAVDDSQLQRDLEEWARAYDSQRERMESVDTHTQNVEGRYEIQRGAHWPATEGGTWLPGTSGVLRDYRPHHLPEEDIPFEHPQTHAREGGDLPASGEPKPGEAQGTAGGGAEPTVRGERGGEWAAGGEAGASGAEGDRTASQRPVGVPEQPGRDSVRDYFAEDFPEQAANQNATWRSAYNEARTKGYSNEASMLVAERAEPGPLSRAPESQVGERIEYAEPDGARSTVAYYYDSQGNKAVTRIKVTERADTPGAKEYLAKDKNWKPAERGNEIPEDALKVRGRKAAEKVIAPFAAEDRARPVVTQAAASDRGERVEPKETIKELMARLKAERAPAEKLVRDAIADPNTKLVLVKGDKSLVLTRGTEDAPFRITSIDKDGPVGHRDYSGDTAFDAVTDGVNGMVSEVHSALRNGYTVRQDIKTEAPRVEAPDAKARLEKLERNAANESYSQTERNFYAREAKALRDQLEAAPLATERTAQGEQTLVPGVAPVTDRQRVEAEMAKPMRGGEAAPGGLFDMDARAQKDLLDTQALRPNRAGPGGMMPGEERRDSMIGMATAGFSPDQQVRLQSLHQLSVNLAEALDIPLRQGRMAADRQTLGIYKTKSGVVRVREIADFEVVKHEAGHAVEAKVGQELTDLTQKYRYEMAPLDYDQGATGQRANEGFAEWMRVRMTNPAAAERLAPTFSAEFEALLAQKRPDILQVLNETAVAHRQFLDARSIDVVQAVVRNTIPMGNMERVAREIAEEGLPPVVNTYLTKGWQWMQRQYDHWFDRWQDMERATRDLLALKQKQQGGGLVDLPDVYNPSVLIRSARRAGQGAYMEAMYGIIPYRQFGPVGPSPKDVFNEALGKPFLGRWNPDQIKDLDYYASARMSAYLWERYDQGLIPNEPSPIKPGDAAQAVQELEAKYPNFKRAGDMLHEMYGNIRKKKLESGLWSQEVYDKTSEYDFYVPMKRVMEDAGGTGGSRSGASLASAARKRVGSERDIDSPLRNVMRDIFFMEQEIRWNEVKGALINLAESVTGEGGRFAERLPQHEAKVVRARLDEMIKQRADQIGLDPAEAQTMIDTLLNGEDGPLMGMSFQMQQAAANGEPIIFHWQGGEPIPYRIMSRIDKEVPEGTAQGRYKLFQLLTEAPAPILDMWSNLISIGAGVMKGGITTNPMFLIANYLKDQLQVALSQPGYIPLLGGVKGTLSELFQGEIAKQRAYAGGVMGGSLVGEVERKFDAALEGMAKQGYLIKRFSSWKGFLEFTALTEMGTRNSIFEIVYNQKRKQGLSEYEAGFEAAHRSTDIMDFSRNGDRMEWVRRNVPFLNPAIQGSERYLFRGMVEPFFRKTLTIQDKEALNRAYYTWLMSAGGGIAGGMGYAALNWEKDAYRDANPDIKGTHVVVPMTNGEVGVIPKPFELGVGFTAGEYAYAMWVQHDPRAAAQFGEAVRQSLAPPNPVTNLPLVTPGIEIATNHSFFRGGPIVPDQVANAAYPELEYNDKTSSLAKYMGKVMGWSPMKIDYAMGSLFGSNGRDLMSATSMVDRDTPTQALDDTVFVRRFLKNAERISGRTKEFWELMAAKTGKYANDQDAYRKLVKEAVLRGQPMDAATQLLNKMPAPERVYVALHEGADARGRPAFTADDRRMHPLSRAHEAVTLLGGVVRDVEANTLIPYREKEKVPLSPDQRRELIDDIRTMAGAEMRNAFVAVGQPGYQGRPIFDVHDYMDVIRKVSPAVADEIATRYSTAKIYSFDAIREAWPELRQEITRYGTDANIRSLTSHTKARGYEFQAPRAKKPPVIRQPIAPQPAPTP